MAEFDKLQLELGERVEMEHTTDPEEAKKIANDHLTANPLYYTKLYKAGLIDEDVTDIIEKYKDDPNLKENRRYKINHKYNSMHERQRSIMNRRRRIHEQNEKALADMTDDELIEYSNTLTTSPEAQAANADLIAKVEEEIKKRGIKESRRRAINHRVRRMHERTNKMRRMHERTNKPMRRLPLLEEEGAEAGAAPVDLSVIKQKLEGITEITKAELETMLQDAGIDMDAESAAAELGITLSDKIQERRKMKRHLTKR